MADPSGVQPVAGYAIPASERAVPIPIADAFCRACRVISRSPRNRTIDPRQCDGRR